MFRLLPPLLVIVAALFGGIARGQVARDRAVELTAVVQEFPPQITLNWRPPNFPVNFQKVFRRSPEATVWNELATLADSTTSYADSTIVAGVAYEYFVFRLFSAVHPGSAVGYVSAGLRVPAPDVRGRAILLVDDTVATPLAPELTRFTEDLVGDGWTVLRQDVSRTALVTDIKAIVQAHYNTDPAHTRALILFGHVPVPYSGDLAPDGHPDHRGAWPADVYYGDMDGVWTDSIVNNNTSGRLENRNVPGDGKFDQSGLPSAVEIEVGRIDLANMAGAAPANTSEADLLRQYLNRDHAFRFKAGAYANIGRRGLIADSFGYFGGEAFAASGWRNITSFFGSAPGSVVEGDWFTNLQSDSYLWAYGCGGGGYDGALGIGYTVDFATKPSRAVFNMLFGSYFGDWDVNGSFLRAPLAGRPESLGLVSVWAGRPHWHLYQMATGETIGYGARRTQNNGGFSSGGHVINLFGRGVHVALLGDPTLRLHSVAPITNLAAESNSGRPVLTWTASPDGNIEGYTVSRASSAAGPFERLGGSLVTATTFTDRSGVPGQSYTYLVRAVKLESTASGTYLNPSQGLFVSGSFSGSVVREMNVTGNGRTIVSGDIVAAAANGTDFGSAEATVQSVSHTFTIANGGTETLSLTGSPLVQISGPAAADFSVVMQPPNSVGASANVIFQVVFAPSTIGVRPATVSIASDDDDENPFEFALRGTGLPPTPEIFLSPASIDRTLPPNNSTTAPVTIDNTGPGALHYTIENSQSGYSFRDSNSFGGPGYAWIEIGATGTPITDFSNPDDATSGPIPLGFSFPFFGGTFTTVRVCTNGFISFTDSVASYGGVALPSIEAPGNIIAAFWDDLILDGGSRILTQQIGDVFVVQFENIARFGAPTQRVTCEIILRQSGEILLQYKQTPGNSDRYTVGLQNGLRTEALQIVTDSPYVQPLFAIRILPPGFHSWLATNANMGTVGSNGSDGVTATLNSAGLSPGCYFAVLNVRSDDADEALLSVPVQLTVPGAEVEVLGNGLGIASGDTTPVVVDGTDFTLAAAGGGSVSRTFTIRNAGSAPLNIGAVLVSGSGFSVMTQPAGSVAPLGSTSMVIRFAPATAGVVPGTVSFTTNDADESGYQFAVTGRGLSPIENWRLTHFGTPDNSGNATTFGNPDGDTLPNLLEFAFGTNPKVPDGTPLVLTGTVLTQRGSPTTIPDGAVFARRKDFTFAGLSYLVQFSGDLMTWQDHPGAPTVLADAGDIEVVSVPYPPLVNGQSAQFFRVSVTLAP